MMHKYVMIRIGGKAKKRKLIKKERKLNKNRGKFRNFDEIGGEIYEFCGNR